MKLQPQARPCARANQTPQPVTADQEDPVIYRHLRLARRSSSTGRCSPLSVAEFRYIDIFISPVFSIFGDFFIACKFHVSEVEKL
eukprot:s2050_g1.t1